MKNDLLAAVVLAAICAVCQFARAEVLIVSTARPEAATHDALAQWRESFAAKQAKLHTGPCEGFCDCRLNNGGVCSCEDCRCPVQVRALQYTRATPDTTRNVSGSGNVRGSAQYVATDCPNGRCRVYARVTPAAAARQLATPSRAGQHAHRCGACGTEFWHSSGSHNCPSCGRGPWYAITKYGPGATRQSSTRRGLFGLRR